MKFNEMEEFIDFHDSGLKNSAKCLCFTLFTARGENNEFRDFLKKHEQYLKTGKFQN